MANKTAVDKHFNRTVSLPTSTIELIDWMKDNRGVDKSKFVDYAVWYFAEAVDKDPNLLLTPPQRVSRDQKGEKA